jgi:hypothetical protein
MPSATSARCTSDRLVRTLRGPIPIGGVGNISIGVPEFAATPIVVVVTLFWEGQNRGVGYAETLDYVEPHYIRRAAGNGAENYFVSLLAIGPRE